MADPIVNFFKSTLVGTYSNTDTSFTIATGDGALLPDPSTDGEFNLTLFKGLQVNQNTVFEIVRVTARSGDVLTVTRGAESTTPITVDSEVHSILMSATKKTFDDIQTAIDNVDLTNLSSVESLLFDTTGDEEFGLPAGTTDQRPASPSAGYMRWNTSFGSPEIYTGNLWLKMKVDGLALLNTATASASGIDGELLEQYVFQGSSFGYTSGGVGSNVIDKFSFTSDSNATDVGDLTQQPRMPAGGTSISHGYTAGSTTGDTKRIEKFAFASDGNASDIASMSALTGQSGGSSSESFGYAHGGSAGALEETIEKYSFSSDANATDVGDLTTDRKEKPAGMSSTTHGYSGQGDFRASCDKFSFASDGNATLVGSTTGDDKGNAGTSSDSNGYIMHSFNPSTNDSDIERISFASDSNGVIVASHNQFIREIASQSSTSHGYVSGGQLGNGIRKFDFSSETDSTDVADLTVSREQVCGQQV